MEKIKQNTNCRRWASLWLVMAMAVMTAIFLRGGVVVQAEENENSVSIVSQSIVNNTTSDEGSMNLTVSKGDSITMSVDIGDSNVEGITGIIIGQMRKLKMQHQVLLLSQREMVLKHIDVKHIIHMMMATIVIRRISIWM